MSTYTTLGIESSCDETAVAIIRSHEGGTHPELLTSVISTQIALHRLYGGVVPELASRNHSVNLPIIIRQACAEAGLNPADIDVFAATAGPGLAAALTIGNSTAKALSLATGKPFISVNHLEGHLLSPFLRQPDGLKPNLGMVVSGGHTLFIKVDGLDQYTLLGRSVDDAAGEAFDKVAKMLELPYPGGPSIDKLAKDGDPAAFDLPRSMIHDESLNVSFSGLKTAVLYTLPKIAKDGNPANMPHQTMCNLCASFRRAVTDVLVTKALKALKMSGYRTLSVSGGVSCNAELRQRLLTEADKHGFELILPDFDLTTDNAAMIAFVASLKAAAGLTNPLDADIDPNLSLAGVQNRA